MKTTEKYITDWITSNSAKIHVKNYKGTLISLIPVLDVRKLMEEFVSQPILDAESEFIWKLMPDWIKTQPKGWTPTFYGTLSAEEDKEVSDRVKEILNRLSLSKIINQKQEVKMKTGIEIIAEERQRHPIEEGFTAKHDEQHFAEELATAGAIYALPEHQRGVKAGETPKMWPWASEWYKPTPDDRVKELAKAGSLCAAEIDRINNDRP